MDDDLERELCEEQKRRRIAAAEKDDPDLNDVLEFFDACSIGVKSQLYKAIMKYSNMQQLLTFVENFSTHYLSDEEQSKISEFFEFFNDRHRKLDQILGFSEV